MDRYQLQTCFGVRALKWKTGCSAPRLGDLTGEVVACLQAGDDVQVVDVLRGKVMDERELMTLLRIPETAKRGF